MTMPRAKIWTSSRLLVALSASGSAGQVSAQTLANLRTALDISHLVGYTVIDTRIRALIHSDDGETGGGFLELTYGIGIFAAGIDDGDFPDLSLYEGDWLLWGAVQVQLPSAASTIVLPPHAALEIARSQSARRISDVGQSMFMVWQQSVAEGVDIQATVSHLVLMP